MKFKVTAKVHEEKGKKVVKFPIPTAFQGHTFAVDFSINGDAQQISDDYRIEYILGNSFINDQLSLREIEFDEGFSNLILAGKMKEIEEVADFMATTAQETLMQNAEWAIDGTSLDKLSGDDYYDALEAVVSKTIEILYKQNTNQAG